MYLHKPPTFLKGKFFITKKGGCHKPYKMAKHFSKETKMNKTFKRAVSSVLASAMAFSSVTVATVSTTLPFTAAQAFAADATIVDSFNVSDLTAGVLTSNTKVGNFTLLATTDKPLTIESNKKSADGYSFTQRMKTGGKGEAGKCRAISFTTTGAGNVVFYALSGKSSQDRTIALVDESGATVASVAVSGSDFVKSTLAIPKAGTYNLVPTDNSVNFYFVGTDVALAGGDDTTTTTEATTATDASTETTTEASTETTTVTTTTEGSTETTTVAANWQIKADTAPAEGYADGALVFENEYAAVYAAQKLSITGKPLTVNGRTYEKGFKTNGVNTVIDGTSFRLAFKVVVKKSTRVSADTSGGSKNSIFSYDETAGTYTNLTGLVPQSQTMYADLEAGTVAYIGNGGTNNSMLAVDIQKGPTPVTVTTKLTLGNAATTIPANAIVTIGDQTVTADENGNVEFNGKTSTSYKVSYEANGVRYESTLSIGDDGTVTSTLNLPQVSGDATVTVKTANGTAVASKKVTLTYYVGAKPVFYTVTTDENGVATFPNLGFNTYNVAIAGYTSTTETFAPVEGNIALTINDATAKNYSTLPANASNDNLYVGYTPNATVTTTYDSVQDAVDNATAGQTIYVAAGTYKELVTITKDIKIVGASADNTIITYNDSQSGNDGTAPNGATDKTKFHGDTVAINGSVNVEFENIQIKNTAEADLGVAQNATALSAYGDNLAATVKLTNCTIWATRDTIFTGKVNANNTWTFDNCTIAGFQDVVCGTGDVTLNDCIWELSLSSDARFLVPNSSLTVTTKMVANNLTINDTTDTGFTAKTYLGRGWGTSGCSLASTQVIVNGYTDNSGTLVTDGVYHGYDTSLANNDGTTLADANWLVRAKQNENYYTTNRDLDTVAINTLQTPVTKDEDGDYLFKGVVNNSLLAKADYIGFAVFNADGTFVGNTKNDTVYRVTGEEGDNLYTVNYFKNMPAEGCIVKGFVQYDGVNIMNEVSNQTVTAE